MTQTIQIPDAVFERLERAAAATRRPVEDVLVQALNAGLPPSIDDAPSPIREELRRLESLPDAQLWDIWRSQVPDHKAARHYELLERNSANEISADERRELTELREAADRLMVVRAYAAAHLRWRGHSVAFDQTPS